MDISRRRRRAFSLLEIVLCCALLGLLFTIVFQILIPSLGHWRKGQLQSEVQQSALVAATRIAHEVRSSTIESVSVRNASYHDIATNIELSRDAIACLSAAGADGAVCVLPDASLAWQKRVIFYLDESRQLLLCQQTPYAPGQPAALQPLEFTPDPSRDTVVARNIWALALTTRSTASATGVTNPVLIQVGAFKEGVTYTLETSASARHPLK